MVQSVEIVPSCLSGHGESGAKCTVLRRREDATARSAHLMDVKIFMAGLNFIVLFRLAFVFCNEVPSTPFRSCLGDSSFICLCQGGSQIVTSANAVAGG